MRELSERGVDRVNWEQVAIEDLKNHKGRMESLENIMGKIKVLQAKSISINSSSTSTAPIKGGGNRVEDKLLNNIVERERLKATYKATKYLVEITERGLSNLNEDERFVLDAFYIEKPKRHIEKCMERLCVEQSQVYRIKDRALYKFTIAMYGILDY